MLGVTAPLVIVGVISSTLTLGEHGPHIVCGRLIGLCEILRIGDLNAVQIKSWEPACFGYRNLWLWKNIAIITDAKNIYCTHDQA